MLREGDVRLLILRHGEAEDTAPDFDRVLTSGGRDAVTRTCAGLDEKGCHPSAIASSPLVRARETAAIVVSAIAEGTAIQTWDELESGADCAATCRRFDELDGDHETVLVVTHQPFASKFVEYLTGQDTPMKTAMVACVEGEVISAGCCELKWTLRG